MQTMLDAHKEGAEHHETLAQMGITGRPFRLLIVGADPVSMGAYSVRVRAFVRWFARRGYEVDLVSGTSVRADDELLAMCRQVLPFPFGKRSWPLGWLLQRLCSLPDIFGPWARKVAQELPARIIGNRPDLVLVSSPPHGMQLLGSAVAQHWGVPYVADLRDDWVGNHRARWPTPLHLLCARRLEGQMVGAASLILANTRYMRDQFLSRHPRAAEKVAILTNGFNENEFERLGPDLGLSDRVRVGYFGGDYAGYVPHVLEGMARHWVSEGQQEQWRITAYTGAGEFMTDVPSRLLSTFNLLPSKESAEAMNTCDLLLLIMPPGEREPSPTVPLKTYSYLRTGIPIVYCGESGATTDLLGEFDGTFCLPRCGGAELARFLAAHRDAWVRRYPREGINRYSFESLGAALEKLLCDAIARSQK